MKPSPELLRQLSNVDELLERSETGEFSSYFDQELTPRAIVGAGVAPEDQPTPLKKALEQEREYVLAEGHAGLEQIRREGENADLPPSQLTGLEAIILLTRRPAILIQRGAFLKVPPEWKILESLRNGINKTIERVGRIELTGHPEYEWVGTGFLVGENVLMTNRHVAEVFSQMEANSKWHFKPGMSAQVDYVEEFGVLEHAEFGLSEVIGVHDKYDMALFRVESTSSVGDALPVPLTLASEPPQGIEGRQVYVCGYPAWDGRRNDPKEMLRIFNDIFDVKRLAPGEISGLRTGDHSVTHNCTTLGGNSGSPVIDLETNLVLGLHFNGKYRQTNRAVALWQLTEDPLLKDIVNFD